MPTRGQGTRRGGIGVSKRHVKEAGEAQEEKWQN